MKAAAVAMTVILLSVIVLCPSVVCAMHGNSQPDSDSCCHKSHSHPAPCPAKTAPDCPYTVLEKSNTNTGLLHWGWITPVVWTQPAVPALSVNRVSTSELRLVDSTGLFLRNRVLLI
jgi:hypothetical protein